MNGYHVVLATAAIAPVTFGQPAVQSPPCHLEDAKLIAPDGGTADYFGLTVSLSGDTALVGAYGDDDKGKDAGSAYVFVRSGTGWTQQAKLNAADGSWTWDFFGYSVSLSGDTALVGSFGDDQSGQGQGAAYVFVRSGTTWMQQAKLRDGDPTTGGLGRSVSLSGDTALVAGGPGVVFVRSGATWAEEATLMPSDLTYIQYASVALSGDTALLGVELAGGNEIKSGAAYVFVRTASGWIEEAKLVASDGQKNDRFGFSVALEGDTALVGAHDDDDQGPKSGSAYVFVRTPGGWTEEQKLTASDAHEYDSFGSSVSLSGDQALVGAPLSDDTATESGSVYVFARGAAGWTEVTELRSSDAAEFDWFGTSVSLSGQSVLVGAYGDDDKGWTSGSTYAFEPTPPPAAYCTAGTSASGCQASIGSTGTPSASATSGFSLMASGTEGGTEGAFFFGTGGRQAKPWGNGTSFQCVAPPITRAPFVAGSGAGGQCNGSFAQDLNALWCPTCPKAKKNPGACAAVQAQLWYRDPQSTSNQSTSLSDALEFFVGP